MTWRIPLRIDRTRDASPCASFEDRWRFTMCIVWGHVTLDHVHRLRTHDAWPCASFEDTWRLTMCIIWGRDAAPCASFEDTWRLTMCIVVFSCLHHMVKITEDYRIRMSNIVFSLRNVSWRGVLTDVHCLQCSFLTIGWHFQKWHFMTICLANVLRVV